MFGGGAPAPVAQVQPAVAAKPAPGVFDDPFNFGGAPASSPSPAAAAPAPAPAAKPFRPAVIKTEQYGAAWKSLGQEVKSSVRSSSCTSSADFMACMQSQMGLHPVQTIGVENICAGLPPNAASNAPANYVLVHGKVLPTHIDLIVKAAARDVAQNVAKQLAVVLK